MKAKIMNRPAVQALYKHLNSLTPEQREELMAMDPKEALPAELQSFADDFGMAVSLFQSWLPIIKLLLALLPVAAPPTAEQPPQ